MSLRLVHDLGNHIEVLYRGGQLFRYVYAPEGEPVESPKPYVHPLRTLAGDTVTAFRPHDHPWHKGLAMTITQVSGQNFWGGPTYVRDEGYVQLDNNGRIIHRSWKEVGCSGGEVSLREELDWVSSRGEVWISEERWLRAGDFDPTAGRWNLDLRFRLKNLRDEPLLFGSPSTEGREMAGYTGLFWRGPRAFRDGRILAAGGLEGPETMGRSAPWLAYAGRHDGTLRGSTVIFLDHPDNPRYPNKWFVRNEPYACASYSFAFDEEYGLDPGQTLDLRYRVVPATGELSREAIGERAQSWRTETGAGRREARHA